MRISLQLPRGQTHYSKILKVKILVLQFLQLWFQRHQEFYLFGKVFGEGLLKENTPESPIQQKGLKEELLQIVKQPGQCQS